MSSRQEPSRPIRRIRIKLTLDGEKDLIETVSRKTRGSTVSGGRLSLTIMASDPQEALEKVRSVAASIKNAQGASKDFK
jgi:hypothetical protein